MSYYQQHQNSQKQQQKQQQPQPQQAQGSYYASQQTNASSYFSMPTGSMSSSSYTASDYETPLSSGILAAFSTSGYPGEQPLLEELGVNFSHIKAKTLAVLGFKSRNLSEEIIQDSDMAGPIIFCLLFGTFLLLSGKTHFGYIYGVALFGTVSLHWLFKLMSNSNDGLEFLRTASVIGYCLLPLVFLSGVAVILGLDNFAGYLTGVVCVGWCTFSSSGFFVRVLSLSNARTLVAYPLAMFYSVFALMAIFVEKKN